MSFFALCLLIHSLTCIANAYQLQTSLQADDWQKYIRAPSSNIVRPVAVLSKYTLGNVTNPDGLLIGKGSTKLTRGKDDKDIPTIVVDFGQNVAGFLSINFGPSKNTTTGLAGVRLAFSETVQFLTNVSDFSRSNNGDTITPGSDQIAVTAGTWTADHSCKFGNKVCNDGLHGFRYLKIYMDALGSDAPYTSSFGTVSINSMSLDFTGYLGTPKTFTGWFESSDDQLNQWWFDGVYTNDMCIDTFRLNDTDPRGAGSPSLVGKVVLYDGAKRDRDPYVGDLAVASRTSYLSHDLALATENVLADLADHQRSDGWIPPASINDYTLPLLDYPLWWVACSYDLYMYTGDTAYISKYYQNMVKVLDIFYPSITDSNTQLITKGLGVSGGYGDYAFIGRTGPVTYYNALYVIALNNAASIAKSLGGHDNDATRWTARATTVSAAINSNNWDKIEEVYFDGSCGPAHCNTHAQDGNSLSIVGGVANSTRAASVLSYLAKNNARPYGNSFYDNDVVRDGYSQRVYAFISYFEIEARFMSGQADSALEEIRRLYGWMANHDPGITMWEGIGPNGSPYEQGFTSMAHGWSSGVVPALTNHVLGVTPKV